MKRGFLAIAVLAWCLASAANARAEEPAATTAFEITRVSNPNAFSVEAFGRGMLANVLYDRTLTRDIGLGVGFGMVGTDGTYFAALVPVFVNVYFARAQGSVFATAGATFVPNSSLVGGAMTVVGNLRLAQFPMIANVGVGYENRSDSGFLIRITAYAQYSASFAPWFGLTLGYSL